MSRRLAILPLVLAVAGSAWAETTTYTTSQEFTSDVVTDNEIVIAPAASSTAVEFSATDPSFGLKTTAGITFKDLWTLSSGTYSADSVQLDSNSTSGTLTVNDGVVLTVNNTLSLTEKNKAAGVLTINGGSVTAKDVRLTVYAGGGIVNLNGGTLSVKSFSVQSHKN